MTFLQDGKPSTVAFTGDLAIRMDERQYQNEQGPCLQGASSGEVLLVDDAPHDASWPDYAAGARDHGLGPCPSPCSPGSARRSTCTAATARRSATRTCKWLVPSLNYAGVALANMHLYQAQQDAAKHLEIALESRAVIEQAKGILMGQRRCDPDAAFKLLVQLSQHSNRKLRDLAQALVDDTGRRQDTPPAERPPGQRGRRPPEPFLS